MKRNVSECKVSPLVCWSEQARLTLSPAPSSPDRNSCCQTILEYFCYKKTHQCHHLVGILATRQHLEVFFKGCNISKGTDTHCQHNDHLHTNQVELAGEDEAKEDGDGELGVESKTISTL